MKRKNNYTNQLLDILAKDKPYMGQPASDGRLAKFYFRVSPQRISTWRTGKHSFSDATIVEICQDLWPDDGDKCAWWLLRISAERAHIAHVKKAWANILEMFESQRDAMKAEEEKII